MNHLWFGVLCALFFSLSRETLAQNRGDVRLAGHRSTATEGRVEIFWNGRWGTVCDDRFDINEANVICKQLGFIGAERATHRAAHGQGTGRIWMDGLLCTGQESKLKDCKFNGWGVHDCSHREDAGVICKLPDQEEIPTVSGDFEVRLSCPPKPSNRRGDCTTCYEKKGCPSGDKVGVKGIVEVQLNKKWHPVSGRDWNLNAAQVVCGQLGYSSTFQIPSLSTIWPARARHSCYGNSANCKPGALYRRKLQSTVLEGMQCTGLESNISFCYKSPSSLNVKRIPIENVATVHCGHERDNSEHCYGYDAQKEIYRLRAGVLPNIGRVEVRRNGVWGTICDVGWDLSDANVVCHNLGYGSAKKIFFRASFGRGIGAIHYSGLKCKGNENLISDCTRTPDNRIESEVRHYCYQHSGDVGVECTIPKCAKPAPIGRITNNKIEMNGPLGWGAVCAGTVDINAANVVCRETRTLFAKSIQNRTARAHGKLYGGSVKCEGEELTLSDCKLSLASVSYCSNGVVEVSCSESLPDLVPILSRFQQSLTYYRSIDRMPMTYLTCALEENCLSSTARNQRGGYRDLLRFDSLTMNLGTAPFSPSLNRDNWIWHECHNHYHSYENFITYDVLNRAEVEVAEGHKASFCLEDSMCLSGGHSYYRCSTGNQGISVNCGDLYARHLDCQWIDVTDVGNGKYLLRQTVNADRLTPETDYKNNEIECAFTKTGLYLTLDTDSCKHSDH